MKIGVPRYIFKRCWRCRRHSYLSISETFVCQRLRLSIIIADGVTAVAHCAAAGGTLYHGAKPIWESIDKQLATVEVHRGRCFFSV